MKVTCKSGLTGWQGKLRKQYASFQEFAHYSETWGLAQRLGYKDTVAAWDDNPTVQGSTDPSDYRKVKVKKPLYLWLRCGDGGEYENFGQDEIALVDALYELNFDPADIRWINCPRNPVAYAKKYKLTYLPPVGFNTELHQGNNYISLYWGDKEGNLLQPLTKKEQKFIVARLRKLWSKP
jgi:hypothetical protein